MTEKELRQKMNAADRRVSKQIQSAVIAVLVHGMKWRHAAIKHDVTESGICRCIQRLDLKSTVLDNQST